MKIVLMFIFLSFGYAFAQNSYSTKSNWLLDTNSTDAKFHKIQKQLRGFDLAMVEVGYRFNGFYFAIKDKNYPLANYHWDKIKKAIENGIIRRPKREGNSKAMFLDSEYKSMKEALSSGDDKKIWEEYGKAKGVCNACHKAERVPFIEVIDPEHRWQPIK